MFLRVFNPRLLFLGQSLSHCELITDDGIRALSSSTCGQERLTVVELDNCPLITDVTLEHLKSCHRLERIELYDCQQVTRAGIKRIRVSGSPIKIKAVRICSGTTTAQLCATLFYLKKINCSLYFKNKHQSHSVLCCCFSITAWFY